MIFVDSNIPMYLVGASHPHKIEAQIALESAIAAGSRLVTSSEVLQEILHRYVAIKRRDAIADCLQVLLAVVDEVFSVEREDAVRAAEIVQHPSQLSARDAIHIAVMERHGVYAIMTFDADFDRWPGIRRSPATLD